MKDFGIKILGLVIYAVTAALQVIIGIVGVFAYVLNGITYALMFICNKFAETKVWDSGDDALREVVYSVK